MRTSCPDSPVAAQSAPSPYVSSFTVAPSLMLLTTSPRLLSFQTVPPGLIASQTYPPPAATQQSQTRTTRGEVQSVTQSAPAAAARPHGSATVLVEAATAPVCGSILLRIPVNERFHSAPA